MKADLYNEFTTLLESNTLSKTGAYDVLLHCLFDYFNADELKGLFEHIKNEMK